ncbi:unnamed protein product [Mytilus coruscus]|uniref:Uncharacterized protein n=1 Tax=Mytilus coruscus TaxID=42192 RepID=A0A6J8CD78_MYTCO|nr:unnamed protein product [Mytilus coruscus]
MNVHQQYESFDEILLLRERCTECCAGSYKSFHCPFCSTSKFKPTKECKLLSHLESHWKNRLAVGNGKYAVKCNLEQCSNEQTGHYHCSKCDRIMSRKDVAERHFRRCAVTVSQVTTETDRNTAETDDNVAVADHQVSEQCDYVADIHNNIGTGDYVAEKDDHVAEKDDHVYEKDNHVAEKFDEHNYCTFDQEPSRNQTPKETSVTKKCQICKKIVSKRWFKSHLKLHMDKNDDINQTRHHHTVMVDICNGVFASSKNISGPFNPVHVVKITSGPDAGIFCEDNKCIEAQQIAKRGRNYSFECPHARSSHYAIQQYEEILNTVSLEKMVDEKILTQDQGHMVQQLQHQAALEHVPFLVFLRNQHSTSKYFFFLYMPKEEDTGQN